MSRTKTILRSLLAIGAAGALAAFGTMSAFSSTTSSQDNEINTGTVEIGDNDGDQVMYAVSNAKPNQTITRCIRVTYTGTLDSDVKLFTPSTIDALGPHVNLKIEPGTQSAATFPNCAGDFTPEAGGAIYNASLSSFASAHNAWSNGLVDNPGAGTKWALNDSVVYRFTLTVADDPAAEGLGTGLHEFRWEARNQ